MDGWQIQCGPTRDGEPKLRILSDSEWEFTGGKVRESGMLDALALEES